jgi:hypothetical protein
MKVLAHKKFIKSDYDSISEWFYDTKLYDAYRYVFYRFPERLGRALAFFRMGWLNHDWDNHYLNEVVLFKLKRMRHSFLVYGHHSEDCVNYKPKMKSLNLTIKLLERIIENDYTKFYDLHKKKWGETQIEWIPEGENYRMETSVEKANTPELKEQERKEFREAYEKDERMEARDKRIAYAIIGKYQDYWWD